MARGGGRTGAMNWPACQAQGSSGCRHLVPRERAPGARSLEPSSLWIGYGGAERKSQEPGAEPIHTPQYPKNLEPRTSNLEPRTSNLEPHLDLPPSTSNPTSTFHLPFHLPPSTNFRWLACRRFTPASRQLPPSFRWLPPRARRAEGDTFLERSAPAERRWPLGGGGGEG